ncbi:MAG: class I SAM-dependent methyltransferase [Tumebacillaceae bacterium]
MNEWTYHDLLASLGIGGAHPGGFALTCEVLERESLGKTSIVLDAGCGTGQTAAYLARRFGCDVTALDRHQLMLQKAANRFRREGVSVRLTQGDIHALPFDEGTFDLVLVESVTIFTDIPKALAEYARVLRRGGILLDLEMTAERPLSAKELAELRSVYGTKQVPTETEWKGRLQRAGFGTAEVIKGGTVASALPGESSPQEQFPEYDPSETIDPQLYDIMNAHQNLTQKYARRLGYRVYRAARS